jgi:hypothetical protein
MSVCLFVSAIGACAVWPSLSEFVAVVQLVLWIYGLCKRLGL